MEKKHFIQCVHSGNRLAQDMDELCGRDENIEGFGQVFVEILAGHPYLTAKVIGVGSRLHNAEAARTCRHPNCPHPRDLKK